MSADIGAHWESVYRRKAEDEVSWFQPTPAMSLRMIRAAHPPLDAPIADVGGGASRLVDRLLADGYSDLTVVDISRAALDRLRDRLGPKAGAVTRIAADVADWRPPVRYRVWHDRAVFHFLTEDSRRRGYVEALQAGVAAGGSFIVATFAPEGPETCSGLPVRRYGPEDLADALGAGWELVETAKEAHRTPAGRVQPFTWCRFCRR